MSIEDIKKENKNIKDTPVDMDKDINKINKLEKNNNQEKYKEIRENILNVLKNETKKQELAKVQTVAEKKDKITKIKEESVNDKKLLTKNMPKKDKLKEKNKNKMLDRFKKLLIKNTFQKNKVKQEKVEKIKVNKEILDNKEIVDNKGVSKKDNNRKKFPIGMMLLSILVAIVLFITTLGIGIYFLNWHNSGLKKLSVYLPFPAGIVSGKIIKASDYWQDVDTLTHFYNYQVSLGNFKEVPPENEIKNIVWDRLVNVEMMKKLAKEYNIQVTKKQIDFEVDKLVNETGDRDKLSDNLYEYYKWDIPTFVKKVIKPYLLEQKVVEKLKAEDKYTVQAKNKAEGVLKEALANPDNFAELAKKYSDDVVSGPRGGDLGYFNKGVMDPDFEKAVFTMKVGEVKGLVKTKFGYHIIKLEDKKVDPDNSDDIQLKASHILIMPLSVDEIMKLKKKEIKIIRFLDKKIDDPVNTNSLENN